MKWAAFAALILLAGCATKPVEVVRTVEVRVPVSVPCPVAVPEPVYSDTDEALAAAPDLFERVKLLLAGRIERAAHDDLERAARQACGGQ